MRKYILIEKCSDKSRWYAEYIGEFFPLLNEDPDYNEFKTRQLDGFINFVLKTDATIFEEKNNVEK